MSYSQWSASAIISSQCLPLINPQSLETIADAKVEPSLRAASVGTRVQFERQGYFCVDPDSTATKLVFNRTVTLKDSLAKIEKKG